MCDYGLFKKIDARARLPEQLGERGHAYRKAEGIRFDALLAAGHTTGARRLLLELQSRCLAQDDELDLLRTRLQTLEDTVQIQRDLYQRQGLYWLRSQGVSLGPFCPQCQENGGGLIRLYPTGTALCCPYCHALYPRPGCQETPANSGALRHARILPFGR